MRKTPLILLLAAAAAFGGFAATALREAVTTPADAHTPPAMTLPAAATLPSAAPGRRCRRWRRCCRRCRRRWSASTASRCSGAVAVGNDPMCSAVTSGIPEERILESLGFGVIVDAKQGLVLTNHHVIEGADDVSVTLADGRTLKATFRGSDADTDIALMQIPA